MSAGVAGSMLKQRAGGSRGGKRLVSRRKLCGANQAACAGKSQRGKGARRRVCAGARKWPRAINGVNISAHDNQ